MRHSRANNRSDRSNALWGRGSRGEQRSNALWGRGGRRAGVAVASLVVLFAMATGTSVAGNAKTGSHGYDLKAYVSTELLDAITQNPGQTFDVILQGEKKGTAGGFYKKFGGDAPASQVRQQFNAIGGLEASLTGNQILKLADKSYVTSIVANETVTMAGVPLLDSNSQLWPWATGAPVDWLKQSPDAGTIAVVDSGLDASRSDFS